MYSDATIFGSNKPPFGFLAMTDGYLTIKDVRFQDFDTRREKTKDDHFLTCEMNCRVQIQK